MVFVGSTSMLPGLTPGQTQPPAQTPNGMLQGQVARARDPGVRAGRPAAGGALAGLTAGQLALFDAGRDDFEEVEGVGDGLGPRFNLDSCAGCHSQPATGGTSPAVNPQVAVATAFGARNAVPYFVAADGPVREARVRYAPDGSRDGGVHALFVISGRSDGTGSAAGCAIAQEDLASYGRSGKLSFRIPTPVFGARSEERRVGKGRRA